MKATLIDTQGPWLEATLKTDFGTLVDMDEFSIDERSTPSVGSEFDVNLSTTLVEDESWEAVFSSNPTKKKGIENIKGWPYRAFGEVTSIDPVTVDCGFIEVTEVFHTKDSRVIGEYVGFTISSLEAS